MADQIHELSRWEDRPPVKRIGELLALMDGRPGKAPSTVGPSADGEMLVRVLTRSRTSHLGFVFHRIGCPHSRDPETELPDGAFVFVWERKPGHTCDTCRRRLGL